MTGVDLRSTPMAAHELRAAVRTQLEEEYLRLLVADRPALIAEADDARSAGPADIAVDEDELAVFDGRIAAIRNYLGTVRSPQGHGRPEIDYCVLVDLGDGPVWMLLTDLPVPDDRVVTADSPLGRALLAAHVDEPFEFTTAGGRRSGVVLAVEAARAPFRSPDTMDSAEDDEPEPHRLIVLDRTRSLELLAGCAPGVGRLAFNTHGTPHIELVNFILDGEDVIFRVAAGAKLIAASQGGRFALQVDEIDTTSRSGWTVTVSGPVYRVHGADAERLGERLSPWAAGEKRFILRMTPLQVYGRSLTATAPVH